MLRCEGSTARIREGMHDLEGILPFLMPSEGFAVDPSPSPQIIEFLRKRYTVGSCLDLPWQETTDFIASEELIFFVVLDQDSHTDLVKFLPHLRLLKRGIALHVKLFHRACSAIVFIWIVWLLQLTGKGMPLFFPVGDDSRPVETLSPIIPFIGIGQSDDNPVVAVVQDGMRIGDGGCVTGGDG